jgi:hypothetical protein
MNAEIRPGGIVPKDPNEKKVVVFDWDAESLADNVSIAVSAFTVTALRPSNESPVMLTTDNASIVSGNRKTQVRILAGTLGSEYQLTNHITTDETPAQEKEGSITIQLVDK